MRMNRLIAITGMALLTAGLIGWAALACAQSNMGKLISANDLSAESSGKESGGESGPAGGIPLQPQAKEPASLPQSANPLPAARSAEVLPGLPGLSPLPSSPPPAKGPAMVPLSPLPQQKPDAGAPLDPLLKGAGTSTPLPMQSPAPLEPGLPMNGPIPGMGAKLVPPSETPQPLSGARTGAVLPPLGSSTDPNGLPPSANAPPTANEEHPADLGMTSDSSGNRQEPAVSLEWVGPATAKVSQPNNYTLVVRNICNIPVQQVLVRVRIPSGLSCGDTEPKAVAEGNVLVWELGALQAREEKVLSMKLLAAQ